MHDPVRVIEVPAWLFTNSAMATGAFIISTAVLGFKVYMVRRRRSQNEMRLSVRMGERNRIARELHDSLLQSFQGLLYRLQAIRNLMPDASPEASRLIDAALSQGDLAINEARGAILQLRDVAGVGIDLTRAIAALGDDRFNTDGSHNRPEFRVIEKGQPRRFDALIQDDVYCIAREAVRNAFRHAKASYVGVEIEYRDTECLISVRDDGIGMTPSISCKGRQDGHWGLQGMRERALTFKGDVQIESIPGAGTVVVLRVPAALFRGSLPRMTPTPATPRE